MKIDEILIDSNVGEVLGDIGKELIREDFRVLSMRREYSLGFPSELFMELLTKSGQNIEVILKGVL